MASRMQKTELSKQCISAVSLGRRLYFSLKMRVGCIHLEYTVDFDFNRSDWMGLLFLCIQSSILYERVEPYISYRVEDTTISLYYVIGLASLLQRINPTHNTVNFNL